MSDIGFFDVTRDLQSSSHAANDAHEREADLHPHNENGGTLAAVVMP
jgi:hypothetical protein